MKSIIYLFITLTLLSACGGGEMSISDLIETGDLKQLQERKTVLTADKRSLEQDIARLDSVINASEDKKLPLVTTISTKEEHFSHFVELQGDVLTRQNVLIYPEMSGTLVKVYVKEGDRVKQGQLLARIDDGGMNSQLAQLKTQMALAKTTYDRQKRLWDQKIGTEIQYLQAKTNYEAQKSAVDQFESQLSKYNIRAPFNGVIDDVIKDQGTVVSPGPGSELFRIVNLSDMYVEVSVPEVYIRDVIPGRTVHIDFPVLGQKFESKVRQTGNYIDPANRSFTVEIPVSSMNGLVKPNLTARVEINDYNSEKAILIPQSVISENSEGEQYVFVAANVKDGVATATKTIITTGKTQGDVIEVLSGLKPGDQVVDEGARSVKDGQNIEILSK